MGLVSSFMGECLQLQYEEFIFFSCVICLDNKDFILPENLLFSIDFIMPSIIKKTSKVSSLLNKLNFFTIV